MQKKYICFEPLHLEADFQKPAFRIIAIFHIFSSLWLPDWQAFSPDFRKEIKPNGEGKSASCRILWNFYFFLKQNKLFLMNQRPAWLSRCFREGKEETQKKTKVHTFLPSPSPTHFLIWLHHAQETTYGGRNRNLLS